MELSGLADDEFADMGVSVIGITYDTPAQMKKFAQKNAISYPLLSDSGSKVIRELGLLNEAMPSDSRYFGVPHPGVFLLDDSRRIRGKFAEEDYRKRPLMSDLLTAVREMTAGS